MTSVAYDWQLTRDLDEFLGRAGGFLRSRPARHTVALTVTDALRRRGTGGYGDDPPLFGVLERGGAVRGAFFRTPPYRLNLTAVDERDADALAARLADVDGALPGVMAEPDTGGAFAEAWRRRTGATAVRDGSDRLYRLADLTPPGPVPAGRARVANAADRGLLARWYRDFADAIGGTAQRDEGEWADDRISYGGVSLWETPDGTPVAMAGATPPVAGQVRVGPVYTPASLRGRGYAGAVTVEVSRAARTAGAQEVLLFADLAHPTSNGLYRRIGYRPVADFAAYAFTGARGRDGGTAGAGRSQSGPRAAPGGLRATAGPSSSPRSCGGR
ncbi:GNAT family N-acetyltransferase [Streptomyces sp. M41(2017)]|uniref:GNAT family N-acetyltransferase n=1 Tax=Streptomyces sp. M41(2017) TaxID=1955065 RepID=UPI0009F0BEE5|nr:GNAT family N-acetyltransferase [Streptomyces sp. M41(2017)]OQQ16882.1 GNAT family N-acetyltransferase [Streptomyces sp. M41(2017)]